jgi:DNA-binding response OmpR family regulator
VLLVDDDPVIVRLLEVNFRLEGFAIETASRGDEAVERATASPPDAVVCDVMMPGVDGYDVCRMFRQTPELARVPFVFLTARLQEEGRLAELGDHVAMIAKPFDAIELVATVRRLIEGSVAESTGGGSP